MSVHMHAYLPKSSLFHNTNSPTIHKAVIIINELQLNEIETMAEGCGMPTKVKEEGYDSGDWHITTSSISSNA